MMWLVCEMGQEQGSPWPVSVSGDTLAPSPWPLCFHPSNRKNARGTKKWTEQAVTRLLC